MSGKREPLFPDGSNLKLKFRKVYNYLFQGFSFDVTNLDYEEYWNRLSRENRPVSSFKLGSVPKVVEKGIGISYPIVSQPIRKGGYTDGERIPQGTGIDHADLGLRLEELSNQPLELFAREGARLVRAVALEEEVAGFLQRQWYERSHSSRRGYRNGHRERQVSCGAGEIEVAMPRVSDTEQGFHSQLLEAWQRRSKLLEETIPLLYVEGLSTRDFKRALKPLWGKGGLSRSSISRANQALKEAFNNWRHRNLSLEEIIYLFLDGIYLGVRGNSREKEAMLVAHGINREGKQVILHLSLGAKESTASWKGVLNDLVERGLKPPQLFINDGNLLGDSVAGELQARCHL